MEEKKPLKLKVRKLGIPSHLVEGQLIVKSPAYIPKKGAKVVLKGERGQILIGIADYPFGPVESPYIAINTVDDLSDEILKRAMKKDLYVEKFVKYRQKRRKK